MKASKKNSDVKYQWRLTSRHCLIGSWLSHKGGQGRTLSCAHTALCLSSTTKAANVAAVDLDWAAPGLSYMFDGEVLPAEFVIENRDSHAEETKSTDLLRVLLRVIENGEPRLVSELAKRDGIAGDDPFSGECFQWLDESITKETPVHPRRIRSLVKDVGQGFLDVLPAPPVYQDRNALMAAMAFEMELWDSQVSLRERGVSAVGLLRLFSFYLIRKLGLDFLLYDCRPGISPVSYLIGTEVADLVVLPTTTFKQALEGTSACWDILDAGHRECRAEEILTVFSNVAAADLILRDPLVLADKVQERASECLRRAYPEPSIILPHLAQLASQETFITRTTPIKDGDEKDRPKPTDYLAGIERITAYSVDLQNRKIQGRLGFRSKKVRRLENILRPGEKETLTILVEEGVFGEEPFRALVTEMLSNGLGKRLCVEIQGRTHQAILNAALGEDEDVKTLFAGFDLVAFPHYLLGRFAGSGLLHSVHRLAQDYGEVSVLSKGEQAGFLLTGETCFFSGIPYAFPFSIQRKLLVQKKTLQTKFGTEFERTMGKQFDPQRADWTDIHRILSISLEKTGTSPLVLENDFNHIGVWYDWLEFVYAYGGADFHRETTEEGGRGSDYGVCWINNPATIDGTFAYLDQFWSGVAESNDHPANWYRTLEKLLDDENRFGTLAWSDIIHYYWMDKKTNLGTRLAEECIVSVMPPAVPRVDGAITEGWVLAVPSAVSISADDNGRFKLILAFLELFLDERYQSRFAELGGSPSRMQIASTTHTILSMLGLSMHAKTGREHRVRLEPKITFAESPKVAEAIREKLAEMVAWPMPLRNRKEVGDAMVELAKQVTMHLLQYKSRLFQ